MYHYCYVKFLHGFILQGDENFKWHLYYYSDGYRAPISDRLALSMIRNDI